MDLFVLGLYTLINYLSVFILLNSLFLHSRLRVIVWEVIGSALLCSIVSIAMENQIITTLTVLICVRFIFGLDNWTSIVTTSFTLIIDFIVLQLVSLINMKAGIESVLFASSTFLLTLAYVIQGTNSGLYYLSNLNMAFKKVRRDIKLDMTGLIGLVLISIEFDSLHYLLVFVGMMYVLLKKHDKKIFENI